jgi:hypothetical protein
MCLDFAWKTEFSTILSALILLHHIWVGSSLKTCNSIDNVLSHVDSFRPSAKAQYFVFVEDRATIGYCFELHVMGHPPNWNTYLKVDCLLLHSPTQLAFVKPVISFHIPFPKWMLSSTVLHKYLSICLTTRWGVHGQFIHWLTTPTWQQLGEVSMVNSYIDLQLQQSMKDLV